MWMEREGVSSRQITVGKLEVWLEGEDQCGYSSAG